MSDKAGVWTQLSENELGELSAQGVIKTYPKNSVIVSEGDETDSLYIIIGGRVKFYVSDEDGKEVVLGTQGHGEYFGEIALDGGPRSASVMTLEPSRFAVIPKDKVRGFLRTHPDFAIDIIEKLSGRTRALTENVKSLALMDVYGRVARLLLELAVDEDGQLVIDEKLTQQDIAGRGGASRVMISKISKAPSADGYTSADQKRITINKAPPRHW